MLNFQPGVQRRLSLSDTQLKMHHSVIQYVRKVQTAYGEASTLFAFIELKSYRDDNNTLFNTENTVDDNSLNRRYGIV